MDFKCFKIFPTGLTNLKNQFENLQFKVKTNTNYLRKANNKLRIKNAYHKKTCNALTAQLTKVQE